NYTNTRTTSSYSLSSDRQTVKLSCSLSSGQVTNYEQSWYQQKDGGSPRFLYYYYSSATAGSGDLSRFSASKESNQNKWYLTIQNIQPEDEAHYYCAVWYGASNVFHSDTNPGGTETKPPREERATAFKRPFSDLRSSSNIPFLSS
uniref:Ig-like domain-containing protein n=1 Tax=Naja naja TaxID=35670 RepID=A0A8C6VN56_NAJNA